MEEVKPQAEPAVTEEAKPTPQPDANAVEERLSQLEKRLSDKDSHISKIEGENKDLRDRLGRMADEATGKTQVQKDAIQDRHRRELIEQGYDEKSVDLLLRIVDERSDDKAMKKVAPLILEAAQELVEADPEIDQEFLNKNTEAVMAEYGTYRQEVSPRKIKANLKKAYKIVKDGLAEKAKGTPANAEKDREAMLKGASPTPQGPRKDQAPEDFIKAIENSGASNSHFI